MSFMIFSTQCKKCGHVFDTAFGLVGTRLIAQPAKKCPKCHSDKLKSSIFPQYDLEIKKLEKKSVQKMN